MNVATASALKYNFETGIYRPPSEGGSYSLLIRVSRNCPWNRCEFCMMYKGPISIQLRLSATVSNPFPANSVITVR